jgi:hypothetical protein
VSAKSDPAVPAFRVREKRKDSVFAQPPGSAAHPDPDGDPRQAAAAAGARAAAAARGSPTVGGDILTGSRPPSAGKSMLAARLPAILALLEPVEGFGIR